MCSINVHPMWTQPRKEACLAQLNAHPTLSFITSILLCVRRQRMDANPRPLKCMLGSQTVQTWSRPSESPLVCFNQWWLRIMDCMSLQVVKGWSGPGGEAGALALMLNLGPYVNTSAPSVQSSFSVERAHMLFRSLGLRHLTVVDAHNRVRGIITRKVRRLIALEAPHPVSNVCSALRTCLLVCRMPIWGFPCMSPAGNVPARPLNAHRQTGWF